MRDRIFIDIKESLDEFGFTELFLRGTHLLLLSLDNKIKWIFVQFKTLLFNLQRGADTK